MAYSTEDNAGFLVTALKFGSTSHGGPVGATHERIVVKDPIHAGGNTVPIGRPRRLLDCRVIQRYLDLSGQDLEGATAANCETDISESNGSGTGSLIHGPMVVGNANWQTQHADGPHHIEGEYLFKGSALTETTAL